MKKLFSCFNLLLLILALGLASVILVSASHKEQSQVTDLTQEVTKSPSVTPTITPNQNVNQNEQPLQHPIAQKRFETPEAAAEFLLSAWEKQDKQKALLAVTDERIVTALFREPFISGMVKCKLLNDWMPAESVFSCSYGRSSRTLVKFVVEKNNKGWVVIGMGVEKGIFDGAPIEQQPLAQTKFKTPEKAANALYSAWEKRDKMNALIAVTDEEVVSKLFSKGFVSGKFNCSLLGDKKFAACSYRSGITTVSFRLIEVEGYWRVRDIEIERRNPHPRDPLPTH